ncbi:alcohol oxidase [Armillaria gallica]|uniref:Alcohol oxidase n=1 Tax=Armillaria gallica TaxID=47427 RepID=A0A2H3DA33_ARMGA|nr:alcohol oxidase [Armillaria gallica]
MLSPRTLGFLLPVACSAAIYENFADLPKLDFDYIIVGGMCSAHADAHLLICGKAVRRGTFLRIDRLSRRIHPCSSSKQVNRASLFALPARGPEVILYLKDRRPTPNTPLDWNFTTTPQPGFNGRAVSYPRGFGLGGSSAVNNMVYTRGSSEDYDRYARITGDEGWGWDELLPYILKNERFVAPADHHNTTGEFNPAVHNFHGVNSVSLPGYPKAIDGRVIQATQELQGEFSFNLDYNSGYHLGIGWEQTTVGNGTRSSSETSYLAPGYIDRKNLHVLIHSYVTRILTPNETTSRHKPNFNIVEFTQDAGSTIHTLSPLKEIILSAGSVGTPHILLNSGIGDAAELSAVGVTSTVHLPDVGKNLTDHPGWGTVWFVNDTNTMENVYWRNATFQAEALAEWQANRTRFIATTSVSHLGFFRVEEGVLEEEPCSGKNTGHYEMIFSGGIGSGTIPATGSYLTIGIILEGILPSTALILSPPLINPNFLSHPQDMTVMQHGLAGAQRFLSAPVWEDYVLGISTNITDLEGSIRNAARSIYHPVSTASMSARDADWGVVDPDLKLKKAVGVRVVDASVLPYVPAGHTQAAVYAIAERAADLIRKSR